MFEASEPMAGAGGGIKLLLKQWLATLELLQRKERGGFVEWTEVGSEGPVVSLPSASSYTITADHKA